jgi:hypothetical protein
MKLRDFYRQYSDEQSCKLKFKEIRDQQGVICKKCGSKEHYWQQSIWQYECKQCRFRTTLRSGTVMEGSNLPFRYWLTAMAFLTATKKSISALELQRELGHKRYEPIWAMLHKLRLAMSHRDSCYELKQYIELDDGFFETSDRCSDKDETTGKDKGNQGRGSNRQSKVLVAIQTQQCSEAEAGNSKNRHKANTKPQYLKMTVMDKLDSVSINYEISKSINKDTTVKTDGYKGYARLKEVIKTHEVVVVEDKKLIPKVFPWVHTCISNAKRLLLGIHHSIKSIYMQNYLDEFCYKFNRRYFGDSLFNRLLVAAASSTWYRNTNVYNYG